MSKTFSAYRRRLARHLLCWLAFRNRNLVAVVVGITVIVVQIVTSMLSGCFNQMLVLFLGASL